MERKGYKGNKDNLVLFPNLENRLLEKGLEQLQEKNFDEAAIILEQAVELKPNNKEACTGLILAYYESGKYKLAKNIAKMLLKEHGDDAQVLELYLMILIQLHDYESIINILENRLDNEEIPFEKKDAFFRLLNLSKKMVSQKEDESEVEPSRSRLNLLTETNINKLVMKISELSYNNIRPYVDEIKDYLEAPEGHPFIKTMLISILMDQEFDKEVIIEKFARRQTVIPAALPQLEEVKNNSEVIAELREIENNDPLLYQHTLELISRHIFLIYPFEFFETEPKVWAAAYHHLALQYLGLEPSLNQLEDLYEIEETSFAEACKFLRKLEEISYPII